jgi:hypothetical protein
MVMKYVNWFFRRNVEEPPIPLCPDHNVEMLLRGKIGRPARFSRQSEGEYTHIYYCPVEGCDQTVSRQVPKSQAPVPGEQPARPPFARTSDTRRNQSL